MNSKQVNATVNKLNSFMQNVKDGNLRTILENMQKMMKQIKSKGKNGKKKKRNLLPGLGGMPMGGMPPMQ